MPKWKSPSRRVLLDNVEVGEGFYVYTLIDNEEVFYVGKGIGKRWKAHFHDCALVEPSYKNHKIKKILSDGFKVKVKIIAKNLSEQEALILESKLIECFGTYRNCGQLCNIYTGDIRKSLDSYKWDYQRRKDHSVRNRGINSTATETLVKKAKCLVHYCGMTYKEVSQVDDFMGLSITETQVKTWCTGQNFNYVLSHLKSIKEIRDEQKVECYNLWKKGFLQKQVSDILGIEYWKVKRLIQQYQREIEAQKEFLCV